MRREAGRLGLASVSRSLGGADKGLAPSGGAAKALVAGGGVAVDGQIESRIRRKLRAGNAVRLPDHEIHVVAAGNGNPSYSPPGGGAGGKAHQ